MAKQSEKQNRGDENLQNVENALSKTELFIEKNQKTIWIVLSIIVAIVLIIFGIKKFYLDPRSEEASRQIYKAQQQFEKGQYETALNGDGNYLGFLNVVSEYGSTKSGKLAAYYAGICYMKQEKFNEALTMFEKFKGSDQILAPLSYGLMGDCYMQLDNIQSAISKYEKAASMKKNSFTTPMLLQKLGTACEIAGENAKALKAYQTLKKEYPLSNEAFEIEKKIAKLEELMK